MSEFNGKGGANRERYQETFRLKFFTETLVNPSLSQMQSDLSELLDSISMVAPASEKAYEKYAWLVFFIVGLVLLVFTVGYIVAGMVGSDAYTSITGMTATELAASEPSFANLVTYTARIAGFHLLGFSVLILAMSYAPYRKGDKWSWYAFWIVPLFFIIHLPLFLSQSPPVWSGVIIVSVPIPLSLLGLVLPYRKFFPRKP